MHSALVARCGAPPFFRLCNDGLNSGHVIRHMAGIRGGAAMDVLVLGSGGREHALAWRLALGPSVKHVYVAPGMHAVWEN